jgi:hypothetical protein
LPDGAAIFMRSLPPNAFLQNSIVRLASSWTMVAVMVW